jgi:hypothetical protein
MSAFLIRLVMLAGMAGISGAVSAQDVSGRIRANLENWLNEYAAENVYVHLDKPFYATCQHVCLIAFVLDASNLKPTTN